MQLADFNVDVFLRDIWQKRPLLIRNPWAEWRNPLAPDELAGLACEDGVEARMIAQKAGKTAAAKAEARWRVEHGPLSESRFGRLGKAPWTLLVQAVDHYVPEVAALIEPFRFIPNWRIDDVMVSYASDGGGVGPHFDQYDVFLVQGLGRRRWRVGGLCDAATELLVHDDLRLIANFEPTDEWILEPGDILYVPPRFAHDGVAVGDDCMTYSIGFRAPSRSELVAHYCDDLLARLEDEDRYADPDLARQANPGEISASAIASLHAMVTETILDPSAFARWFGEYTSTRKYPEVDWRPEEPADVAELRGWLAEDGPLCRNPASRFSFVRHDGGTLSLFVDGQSFACEDAEVVAFAERLCAEDRFAIDRALLASDTAMALIVALFNQGSVALDQE